MSNHLTEIERQVSQLSPDEQLWLIERLVHGLRGTAATGQRSLPDQLAAMATDPEIQRELQAIHQEFSVTEADGLK